MKLTDLYEEWRWVPNDFISSWGDPNLALLGWTVSQFFSLDRPVTQTQILNAKYQQKIFVAVSNQKKKRFQASWNEMTFSA